MLKIFIIATVWLTAAVIASIIAKHLKLSMALIEICIGILFCYCFDELLSVRIFSVTDDWLRFLASTGAILLTFLAGSELEPVHMKKKWKEVIFIGLIGFFAPFIGCSIVAKFILHWNTQASLLCGIALSTTSMAVVYAVMLETGFNKTDFGKGVLGACFVNDLGTVIALGLIFAPFNYKTIIFICISAVVLLTLPFITSWLTEKYAHRTAAIRTKWVILILFGLGSLAQWAGSEAVLPAYIAGMVLAKSASRDPNWVRRLRTLTIGFLTPFYFIRAGSLVSLPLIVSLPLVFFALLAAKVLSKIFGLYPLIKFFKRNRNERWYYTLLMSTGLTFGTISALYGLTNNIVTRQQYSFLVAVVIASAVIPAIIAGRFFLPKHLLESKTIPDDELMIANTGKGSSS